MNPQNRVNLTMKPLLSALTSCLIFGTHAPAQQESGNADAPREKPNFVLIFTDDQGYGDLGCFGSKTIRTPILDRLAAEGRKFTNFVSASSVCTPSRAALLTGSYPKRLSMAKGVLFPTSTTGFNPDEHTIADHLKQQGYATACFGKWHLGHHPETLPRAHGFDVYFGIPYSNDMNHPDNEGRPQATPEEMDFLWNDPGSTLTKWKTPLMENEKIVELPVDQRTITRRCTDRGVAFIKENQKRPFFLYLPYSMPHVPLYVPDDVRDPDPKRAYINTIEHLDTEVGRIFDTLRDLGLAKSTYVIFTSDNGPWLKFKHHGGTAGPLRDGKMSTFEGGQRVPAIIWAPGRIPAGTQTDGLVSTIDVLPTIASLTGTPLPAGRRIDGVDISPLLAGNAESPRKEFLYYAMNGSIEGIRQGDWKLLVLPPKGNGKPDIMLFNLAEDIGEKNNLASEKAELVERLTQRMKELDAAIEAEARPVWNKP
jgi:arylsulfatase A-like enzyme